MKTIKDERVDFDMIRQSIGAPMTEYLKMLYAYLDGLKKMPPEEVKSEAHESLYR